MNPYFLGIWPISIGEIKGGIPVSSAILQDRQTPKSIWMFWRFQDLKSRLQMRALSKFNFGILLPKLFWPTVIKNCSSDREKLLKFEAESREFSKILRSLEQFMRILNDQNNVWNRVLTGGFYKSNKYSLMNTRQLHSLFNSAKAWHVIVCWFPWTEPKIVLFWHSKQF